MTIVLNGEERASSRPARPSAALLDALDVPGGARGVAVAVDAEVVPRGEWETTSSTTARGSRSCARSREADGPMSATDPP